MEPEYNLIIDTDVGCDDTVAICMALEAKHAKIHAITTVFGNVTAERSTINVATLLSLYNRREVPIYLGCSEPIIADCIPPWEGHGVNGFGGWYFSKDILKLCDHKGDHTEDCRSVYGQYLPKQQEDHAAIALIKMINEKPNFYDLIMLGPLTNFAVALKLDPSIATKLKSMTWMGGTAYGKGNSTYSVEFNAHADPEAVAIVVNKCPNLTIVPFEICWDNSLHWEHYDKLTCGVITSDEEVVRPDNIPLFPYIMKRVNRDYEKHVRKHVFDHSDSCQCDFDNKSVGENTVFDDSFMACDAYAMASLLYPKLNLQTISKHCVVETQGTYCRGNINVDWYNTRTRGDDNYHTTTFITKFDKAGFFELMEDLCKK